MRHLIWSGPAIHDVAAIARFYREIERSLADRVVERIRAAPAPLLERPLIGPPAGLRGARKWTVKGLPYVLLYQVTERRIEILRVHHAAQDWAGS